MARLAVISVVLCLLATVFVATADTDINFYFADILAGANSGSCSSESNNGTSSEQYEADAAYAVQQTVTALFALEDLTSNDYAAYVTLSKYSSYITPLVSSSVTLTTDASIVNNNTATSYSGVTGTVSYLQDISSARNFSRQEQTNLVFDFSDDLSMVTVTAVYSGLEQLNSNFSFQTFFGDRTYQLIADSSKQYGYAVTSVSNIRDATRPSPDLTATFKGEAQDLVLAFFAYNDIASDDNVANVTLANYGAEITPLVTSDFTLTSDSPLTGNKTYCCGVQAAVNYLHDVSSGRIQSQQALSSFQFSFNYDQSEVTVSVKYSGWEQLSNSSYDTFYGTRVYTLVRGANGVFQISSVNIVRSASFAATLA